MATVRQVMEAIEQVQTLREASLKLSQAYQRTENSEYLEKLGQVTLELEDLLDTDLSSITGP